MRLRAFGTRIYANGGSILTKCKLSIHTWERTAKPKETVARNKTTSKPCIIFARQPYVMRTSEHKSQRPLEKTSQILSARFSCLVSIGCLRELRLDVMMLLLLLMIMIMIMMNMIRLFCCFSCFFCCCCCCCCYLFLFSCCWWCGCWSSCRWVRGAPEDFDRWAAEGCTGWSCLVQGNLRLEKPSLKRTQSTWKSPSLLVNTLKNHGYVSFMAMLVYKSAKCRAKKDSNVDYVGNPAESWDLGSFEYGL